MSPLESVEESRKLIFPTTMEGVSLVILRGSDVPTYVRHGAADVGVVGKDLLMESGDEGLYEVLDLEIARCRLMTAGTGQARTGHAAKIRVATKFVNVARAHYSSRGINPISSSCTGQWNLRRLWILRMRLLILSILAIPLRLMACGRWSILPISLHASL